MLYTSRIIEDHSMYLQIYTHVTTTYLTHALTRHLYINQYKYTQQSSLLVQAGVTATHSTIQTSHQDFTTSHYVQQHKDIHTQYYTTPEYTHTSCRNKLTGWSNYINRKEVEYLRPLHSGAQEDSSGAVRRVHNNVIIQGQHELIKGVVFTTATTWKGETNYM